MNPQFRRNLNRACLTVAGGALLAFLLLAGWMV